jgi:hypothetical protein
MKMNAAATMTAATITAPAAAVVETPRNKGFAPTISFSLLPFKAGTRFLTVRIPPPQFAEHLRDSHGEY